MTDNQSIIQRLEIARKHLGLSTNKFEKLLGLSSNSFGSAVRKDRDMGSQVIQVFSENYPQFNPYWIITGEGSMLKEDVGLVSEPATFYGHKDGFEQLLLSYLNKESIQACLKELLQPQRPNLEEDFEKHLENIFKS